jgi:phage terminase Nu1 subunit (DNA packaging protein)
VDIATVSLGEFALLVRMSEPTVRKRLADAPDTVVLSRGKNGEKYEIDPVAGVAWWKDIDAAAEAERQRRVEGLQSLQLTLLGEDPALGDHDVDGLTPGEQLAQLQAELAAIKLGRERGELVRAGDMEAGINAFMLKVKETLETLPDRLRKRAEVSEDVASALDKLVNRALHDLADAAAMVGKDIGDSFETQEGTAATRAV